MNAVWFALVVASVLTAAFTGRMQAVSEASVESAKTAVTLALGLIGVMAFWLGMMRIVQEGGLLHALARGLRPVMIRLFPDVPADHPAMSAMILNMAANMLGLGNAATPFGIKAMLELDRLNPAPGVATNAMVLFLAINTSNVALAPLGVIAIRSALGSANPAGIWLPTLLATSCSTLCAILVAKGLQGWFPVVPLERRAEAQAGAAVEAAEPESIGEPRPATTVGCAVALATIALLAVAFAIHVREASAAGTSVTELLRELGSGWLLPVLIVSMAAYGVAKGVGVYDAMIRGAQEGFQVAVRIIPFLVAIVVAAGMFRASGLLDLIVGGLTPALQPLGFPPEALPMAILRPLSGSGAYAVMAEIMKAEGPDSPVGYLVSTLQGSTETTFYVLAVYFGAVAIARVRHAVAAGLIADLCGVVAATAAVRWLLL